MTMSQMSIREVLSFHKGRVYAKVTNYKAHLLQ